MSGKPPRTPLSEIPEVRALRLISERITKQKQRK
jgi:hypothetical protein